MAQAELKMKKCPVCGQSGEVSLELRDGISYVYVCCSWCKRSSKKVRIGTVEDANTMGLERLDQIAAEAISKWNQDELQG